MGFVVGTAITDNDDLKKYVFEQQITNLLRGAETYTELHKGAVNTLIAEHLRPKGFTTAAKLSAIANADDFEPALTYWVAAAIFDGQGGRTPAEREAALGKAFHYRKLYRESLEKLVIDPGEASANWKQKRGLPVVVNVDEGSMYPALGGSSGRPTSIAKDEIDGYDDLVIEGK